MPFKYRKGNTQNAQLLRKNMTSEEKKLWYDFLKRLPYTINRQKCIGEYIVDFYCHSAKLVIELDGSQHYSVEGKEKDCVRDNFLEKNNIKVLRYSNLELKKNFEGVCIDIQRNMEERVDLIRHSPDGSCHLPQGEG